MPPRCWRPRRKSGNAERGRRCLWQDTARGERGGDGGEDGGEGWGGGFRGGDICRLGGRCGEAKRKQGTEISKNGTLIDPRRGVRFLAFRGGQQQTGKLVLRDHARGGELTTGLRSNRDRSARIPTMRR